MTSSMDTLMSLELLSLFSTEWQSFLAAWTMLCFPSSGDKTFTVGLQDTTNTQDTVTPHSKHISCLYTGKHVMTKYRFRRSHHSAGARLRRYSETRRCIWTHPDPAGSAAASRFPPADGSCFCGRHLRGEHGENSLSGVGDKSWT